MSTQLVHPFDDKLLPGSCGETGNPEIEPSFRVAFVLSTSAIVGGTEHDGIVESDFYFGYIATIEVAADSDGGFILFQLH